MAVTLVVETGAGIAGANVYESVSDISTRLSDRGLTGFSSATLAQKEIYAVEGTELAEFMASSFLQGRATDEDQGLLWPRDNEHDPKGKLIDAGVVPEKVKLCCALFAEKIATAGGNLEAHDTTQGVAAESRDGESIAYKSGGGTNIRQRFPDVWLQYRLGVDLMLRSIRA